MDEIKLEIKMIKDTAVLPKYANYADAGLDIYAAEDVRIPPETSKKVSTGLILNIPIGYEVQIRPRSGLSLKTRLRLPNSPGTIDATYKDELEVIVYNASPISSSYKEDGSLRELDLNEKDNRAGAYTIKTGDRICQMLLKKVYQVDTVKVDEFTYNADLDRGGGFGSSGLH